MLTLINNDAVTILLMQNDSGSTQDETDVPVPIHLPTVVPSRMVLQLHYSWNSLTTLCMNAAIC